ncbi:MAG: response regulator [Lachnospiraceae bacterium]|nr:response regulator [Lachnospiraceae bacterium]
MIKLLLADDEDYTREGLIEAIDWKMLGIDDIMQAKNGSEALKIAKWYKPDIVLTDIKMPKVDGIEFAKELVDANENVKIIFMSGFMEVEYLKSAIKLSVIDYIEKPIDIKIVNGALKKAVEAIKENEDRQYILENQKNYEQTQLVAVLTSKIYDQSVVDRLCNKLGFPQYFKYICVLLKNRKINDIFQYQDKIESIIRQRKLKYLISKIDSDIIQIIICFDDKSHYRIGSIMTDFTGMSENVIVAAGMESDSLKNIYGSRQTAELALNSSYFDTSKRVYTVDEYMLNKKNIEPQLYGDYLLLLKENPNELKNWSEELYLLIKDQKYYQKEQIQSMICSFLLSMQQEYPKLNMIDSHFSSEEKMVAKVAEFASFDLLWDYFSEKLEQMEDELEGKGQYSKLIADIIDFIEKNYGDQELGVSEIAEKFRLTPSYINVLFKQETGFTLKKYISNIRIENAKLMLKLEYERIATIAEKCGYANANYFAKVFREETGMTPVEFRKNAI